MFGERTPTTMLSCLIVKGCKTKKAAIDLCKKDREYVMEESSDGSDLGFTPH